MCTHGVSPDSCFGLHYCRRAVGASAAAHPSFRGFVFPLQLGHKVCGGLHPVHGAYALAAAPDVFPGFGSADGGGEIHLARIALGQMVGIEPGGGNRAAQVVAVHAGEQAGVHDVLRAAVHDHLLVALGGARLVGGDEGAADIGQIGPHGLRGKHRVATGNGA